MPRFCVAGHSNQEIPQALARAHSRTQSLRYLWPVAGMESSISATGWRDHGLWEREWLEHGNLSLLIYVSGKQAHSQKEHDLWGRECKKSRDIILAQNFRPREAAACVIHELVKFIVYTMRHFCVLCKRGLVYSASCFIRINGGSLI